MKTKLASFILLFFLVLAVIPASAFYDPGTQRWLTRDPLGEMGGANLYAFTRNAPVDSIDLLGLSVISDAEQAVTAIPKAACGALVGAIASMTDFKKQSDDRYAHCMASCKIAQWCGKDTAVAAGVAKEFYDLVSCIHQALRTGKWDSPQCESAFQPSDFKDNARGIACPKDKTCQEQCNDLKSAPPASPGPFYNLNERNISILIF